MPSLGTPPWSNPKTTIPSLEWTVRNATKANANTRAQAGPERRASRREAARKRMLGSISCRWPFPRCPETLRPSPAGGSEKGRARQENTIGSKACSPPASTPQPWPVAHAKACIVRSWSVPQSSIPKANSAMNRFAAATSMPPAFPHAQKAWVLKSRATPPRNTDSRKGSARNGTAAVAQEHLANLQTLLSAQSLPSSSRGACVPDSYSHCKISSH